MEPITDEELEALLDDLESDRAERKEAWAGSAPEKVRQAVCAFANDLPNYQRPGVVFIGAKDDGTPAGASIDDRLLLTLASIKSDGKVVPPPTLTVAKRRLKGADMAVLCVWPSDSTPVRYEGRIWIRSGPRRDIASGQDERVLNEKRRSRDLHFDAKPLPSTTLGDLSRLTFEQEYLPAAVAPDVLEANGRTYEQQLASCGMIASAEDPVATAMGILCIGISPRTWIPGAYIQFLRLRGTEWGDPVADEQEVDGNLAMMLQRIDDKMRAQLATEVDYKSATLETRTTPYPMVALQQIVRNAVMHRTYEGTAAPVRIYWFDDRIEVHSPGGPYGTVTKENFGRPGFTDYRNPALAAAMKVLGFVQRFGFGIGDARKAMLENGNPPLEFEIESAHVLVILRKRP